MASPGPGTGRYSFGDYTLDLDRGALTLAGTDVALRPKSYAVLCYLVEHHGKLVAKQELLDAVWGHAVVTEGTLTQSLIDVRRALGDDSQQMLRTVRGRGYLFDVPVKVGSEGHEHAESVAMPPRTRRPSEPGRLGRRVVIALGAALAAAVLWWAAVDDDTLESTSVQTPRWAAAARSIAVLPFTDLSPAGDQAYFSHGISEEILNRLSSFRDLHVIARTSSFAFADSGYEVPRLSEILGVQYLLQGSVRKDSQALRISAQLVDAGGRQIWSESFDRELVDVFAIQSEIAEAVASSIVPRVSSPPEEGTLPEIEAYEHYLMAREIVHQRNHWQFPRALELLDRAIAIDPDFAEARVERAVTLTLLPAWPEDVAWAGEQAAQELDRALSLKPHLARAYAARSLLLDFEDRPSTDASRDAERERILTKALELNPNIVDARVWLSNALRGQGRLTEAEAQLRVAARLDPLSPRVAVNLSFDEAERGDFAAAEARISRLLNLPEPSTIVRSALWSLYVTTGRLAEAAELARQVPQVTDTGEGPLGETMRMLSYARLGLWEEAETWQAQAERVATESFLVDLNRAWLQGIQGRHEEALSHFRQMLNSQGLDAASMPRTHSFWYGVFLALAGAYDDAVTVLEPVAGKFAAHAGLGLPATEVHQWLAWLHQQTGAPERAAELLDSVAEGLLVREADGRMHSSDWLYQFAINALLSNEITIAMDRLQLAVDAGWREYYAVALFDPRWQPLHDDPRFAALMAAVKADVDAQRAEVQRQDAAAEVVVRD